MNRKRLGQLVLVAGVVFGVYYVHPRLSRRSVRFEVGSAPRACIDRVSIDIRKDGATIRRLGLSPAPRGALAVYETALHPGPYDVRVVLDCTSGAVKDGKARPIVITDEAAIHLQSPSSCDCGSFDDRREDTTTTND